MSWLAELYIADCLYKVVAIKYPVEEVVFYGHPHMPIISALNGEIPMRPVELAKMIFERSKQTGPNTIRYDFRLATGRVNTFGDYEEIWETPLQDPDENVNMDKLKKKLRDNINAKKVLSRFFEA